MRAKENPLRSRCICAVFQRTANWQRLKLCESLCEQRPLKLGVPIHPIQHVEDLLYVLSAVAVVSKKRMRD